MVVGEVKHCCWGRRAIFVVQALTELAQDLDMIATLVTEGSRLLTSNYAPEAMVNRYVQALHIER